MPSSSFAITAQNAGAVDTVSLFLLCFFFIDRHFEKVAHAPLPPPPIISVMKCVCIACAEIFLIQSKQQLRAAAGDKRAARLRCCFLVFFYYSLFFLSYVTLVSLSPWCPSFTRQSSRGGVRILTIKMWSVTACSCPAGVPAGEWGLFLA